MTFKAAVDSFIICNLDVYPYSAVPHTRSGYHPKWLLAMSGNTDGIFTRNMGYYVIKASCLNRSNLMTLIMDGDAMPLPPDFADVVDTLETWGAGKYPRWLQQSLFFMHGFIEAGVAPNKMKLFHDSILPMVGWRAAQQFGRHSASFTRVLTLFETYFWVRCLECHTFRVLAINSWWFVDSIIDTITRESTTTQTNVVRATDVVPESPVSHSG